MIHIAVTSIMFPFMVLPHITHYSILNWLLYSLRRPSHSFSLVHERYDHFPLRALVTETKIILWCVVWLEKDGKCTKAKVQNCGTENQLLGTAPLPHTLHTSLLYILSHNVIIIALFVFCVLFHSPHYFIVCTQNAW